MKMNLAIIYHIFRCNALTTYLADENTRAHKLIEISEN